MHKQFLYRLLDKLRQTVFKHEILCKELTYFRDVQVSLLSNGQWLCCTKMFSLRNVLISLRLTSIVSKDYKIIRLDHALNCNSSIQGNLIFF